MKRKHVPQFTNQKWFPTLLKTCIYEFMTWFVGKVKAAHPFVPVIKRGLQHTNPQQIINIDSQLGAGFETVQPLLDDALIVKNVLLEDFQTKEHGLYVSVNAFHQLKVSEAKNLLHQIAKSGHPIVIVEGNNDSLWQVVGMTIFVPLTVLLTAPFVQPFRWERLLFTYLIPILPIVTFIDGFLALFKLYAPIDLNELTASIDVKDYQWESGKLDNGRGGKIIYLLGHQ
jgi:hypothetical protein